MSDYAYIEFNMVAIGNSKLIITYISRNSIKFIDAKCKLDFLDLW